MYGVCATRLGARRPYRAFSILWSRPSLHALQRREALGYEAQANPPVVSSGCDKAVALDGEVELRQMPSWEVISSAVDCLFHRLAIANAHSMHDHVVHAEQESNVHVDRREQRGFLLNRRVCARAATLTEAKHLYDQ